MGAAQDIVIVNEFTQKTAKGGTRGGSPGRYVLEYMARDGATEALAPVLRGPLDDYITRYMLRDEAVEKWPDDVAGARHEMESAEGFAGKAFGTVAADQVTLSLSDEEAKRSAKEIQALFDKGHTVLKTVISLSDDYVRRMHLVSGDFTHKAPGDWAGHVDQARVRSALAKGVEALSKHYDDLRWIGCVQVDASKVHCHLAMVDAGKGGQKGMIGKRAKEDFRQGMHEDLEATFPMGQLSTDVSRDRTDVRLFVKKLTHAAMATHGASQFIVACLPPDDSLWRADSDDPRMRKANLVTRLFVEELLKDDRSGYRDALRDVYRGARQTAEDPDAERRLVMAGEKAIVDGCVDAVYSVVRSVPKSRFSVQTPVLDVMACDLEELARAQGQDPMLEFGLKLRSYSSRLNFHKGKRREMEELVDAWESADKEGEADPDSRPLYEFYRFEEEYNAMLVAKYTHFLSFLPKSKQRKRLLKLLGDQEAIADLYEMLSEDDYFQRLRTPEDAVRYLQNEYNIPNGRPFYDHPELIDRYLREARVDARALERRVERELADVGLKLVRGPQGQLTIEPGTLWPFDEVKALDLHHLDYDFPYDAEVSRANVLAFSDATLKRSRLLENAVNYLEASGQSFYVQDLPVEDVERMVAKEAVVTQSGSLRSAVLGRETDGILRAHPTVRLDDPIETDFVRVIRESVAKTLVEVSSRDFGELSL